MPTKNKLVANHRGVDSLNGFDGFALQAVQFFRGGLQVGVGGFGIHVAQGFAAGFVFIHLISDFQFGACWHVHSPLWVVTVCFGFFVATCGKYSRLGQENANASTRQKLRKTVVYTVLNVSLTVLNVVLPQQNVRIYTFCFFEENCRDSLLAGNVI